METRKVYISGGSSYVVSLPKKWIEKNKITPGDSLAVWFNDEEVIFRISDFTAEKSRKISIHTEDFRSIGAVERYLVGLYLTGFDTIRVMFGDSEKYRDAVVNITGQLIGCEILTDTGNCVVIEVLIEDDKIKTEELLRRMSIICRSMLGDIVRVFKEGDQGLIGEILDREGEIDKLYFLVIRQLKKAVESQKVAEKLGISSKRDCLGYRMIAKSLERIGDHIKIVVENRERLREAPENYSELAKNVLDLFEITMNAFFGKDIEMADLIFEKFSILESNLGEYHRRNFSSGKGIPRALLKQKILDSFSRIAHYCTDISEITINMSINSD